MRKLRIYFNFVITLLLLSILVGCDQINKLIGKDKTKLPEALEMVIGHGYDITKKYAYSPDIKDSIFDLNKLLKDGLVKRDPNLSSGTFESIEGADITSYQKSLSTKISASVSGGIKKIGSFSAEIEQNFSSEQIGTDEHAFATSSTNVIKDAYYITEKNTDKLFKYLTDDFIQNIKTLDAPDIIRIYGTHSMQGGILGARLDYHMSAKKKIGASSINIGAYAKAKAEASLKGIFSGGASGSAEIDTLYANSFETSSVIIKTKVYGGKPEYAQAVQNERDYQAWIESIEGREIWCDYYPKGLIELSELINDKFGDNWQTIKQNLSNYINEYLEGNVFVVENKAVSGKITENQFTIALGTGNASYTNSRGDREIDSESGSETVWEIWVNNQIVSDKKIKTTFRYKVWETKGDWSIIEIVRTVEWSTPNKIKSINSKDIYINGKIIGKNDSLVMLGDKEYLSNLQVQIDGTGEEDQKNIKAIFNFTLEYEYYAFLN